MNRQAHFQQAADHAADQRVAPIAHLRSMDDYLVRPLRHSMSIRSV